MNRHYAKTDSRIGGKQAFTWCTLIGRLEEIESEVAGFYRELVREYEYAKQSGDREASLFGWELRREMIDVFISLDEGLTISLLPKFANGEYLDDPYLFGGARMLATVENVGGRPALSEFRKVLAYFLQPLRDKVGRVDDSEIVDFCGNGSGYMVVTSDESPYEPLFGVMKAMKLVTPDDLLVRMGLFGPQQ